MKKEHDDQRLTRPGPEARRIFIQNDGGIPAISFPKGPTIFSMFLNRIPKRILGIS